MASAVLASQNESSWALMGKNQYSNPHLNTNPNPNPKKKQKQFHHAAANGASTGRFHGNNHISNNLESPAVTQTASDDAYSFNQKSTVRNAAGYGGYLSYNVAAYSKSELLELRKRLSAELDQIRDLRDRIDSVPFSNAENHRSQLKPKKLAGNKKPSPAVGSVPQKSSNGFDSFRTESVDFDALLKECGKIVAKLLKHKHGYIFKLPVDAAAMGLHDYHQIVKRPMDLGTVKANLAKNQYRTPVEFADDVRLTFNNALLYNPKTDLVNGCAEQLLAKFEELYRPVQDKLDSTLRQQREFEAHDLRVNNGLQQYRGFEELQGSSWNHPVNRGVHSSHPLPEMSPPQLPVLEPLMPSPVRAPSVPMVKEQKVGRAVGTTKLPKPKAKDPNKRDMSMEEKQKLGLGLQSLPQEKMPQLVQIIRKKNQHLAQDGDEIELDIETLDNETLWELDRFVTNWKKMVSKSKRQVLMHNPQAAGVAPPVGHPPASPVAYPDMGQMIDKDDDDDSGKKIKDNDDEDVDIDDDMPVASFPPVEIEKDEGVGVAVAVAVGQDQDHGQDQDQDHDTVKVQNPDDRVNPSSSSSSSGSSSSGSSSSSDSDSGSSSGSDSDADDAQS